MTMTKLSSGCTRSAFLLDDNTVIKKPNYSRKDYLKEIGPGGSVNKIFNKLLSMTSTDKNIMKIKELQNEGRTIPAAAKNIAVEYMLSLLMTEEEKKYFAICFDIKVRRSPKKDRVSIVGYYENAETKASIEEMNRGAGLFYERTGFRIVDLHGFNLINNIIVDYAAIV